MSLEFQRYKSGIPTVTHPKLASRDHSLPPILYMQRRNSISSYSEAPRGLSVLLRVTGIFTGTTISPSLLLRQCSDHYAFRAGRNLPDKEFRYLRTVIVTAAVYWGLSYRAGVSPYTSSFDLAETCVFGKQLPEPLHCGLPKQAPLLPKLRGYFAEFLNNSSLAHLRILSSSTCVGLRYGHLGSH